MLRFVNPFRSFFAGHATRQNNRIYAFGSTTDKKQMPVISLSQTGAHQRRQPGRSGTWETRRPRSPSVTGTPQRQRKNPPRQRFRHFHLHKLLLYFQNGIIYIIIPFWNFVGLFWDYNAKAVAQKSGGPLLRGAARPSRKGAPYENQKPFLRHLQPCGQKY